MSFLEELKKFFGITDNSGGSNNSMCKAYSNGQCISQRTGKSTGPCSWNPKNWKSCGVVKENTMVYGKWQNESFLVAEEGGADRVELCSLAL